MKEKIWIEKLAELLKEYSYENHDYYWTLYVNWEFEWSVPWTDHDLSKEEMWMVIKSKEYWFVKWIVQKDKINFNGLPNIFTSIYAEKRDDIYYEIEHNNYSVLTEQYWVEHTNRLLMLLSISDTPIEDLISYLR